ncbi:MAG: SpoIID/LytB domain-containing protein [Deltaproteobacteria bacterium]|nr:SpoIID/LytB domain-containing protein [Deltaproteobacteria bacterium]
MISAKPKGLQLVNHIPLEQYLYGVVPREMPVTWAEHALRYLGRTCPDGSGSCGKNIRTLYQYKKQT